jgi:uncharacterized protein YqgV (UPF0045/DUF77 family)
MNITVEISYYPLTGDYTKPVLELLNLLQQAPHITVATGDMSTLISGEFDAVMAVLTGAMKQLMLDYPSVFNIKIANACSTSTDA